MLLRLKICTTIFILYEIVAIMLLHFGRMCDALFGVSFCDDHVFKYFIVCFAIPALAFLIYMWIAEIVHGARRRHSLMYRAKTAMHDVASNVRHRVSEHISTRDLEKLIVAALVLGVRKFAANHPRHRHMFDDFLNKTAGDVDIEYDMEYDDDDEDNDDEGEQYAASQARRASSKNRATSTTTSGRRDSTRGQKRKK